MEEINVSLEKTLGELDYLFQEGVCFDEESVKRFDFLMNEFKKIREDIFFNVLIK